ncbi:MAG: Lon protease-like protein [Halioglobus sp.]|jgi:Lon protease-like protein
MSSEPDREIPLFPLSSVLLPYGKLSLKIFEQRYLDLVRSCMKSDSGFGVVWIRQGSEVVGTTGSKLELGKHGTYAKIIDWDQLPNGLLGVTIEGQHTFSVIQTRTSASSAIFAQASFCDAPVKVPLLPQWNSLAGVLRGLQTHPHVQRMNLNIDYDNAWEVGYNLIQLLPLEEQLKYELQGAGSLETMMGGLDVTLNEISG